MTRIPSQWSHDTRSFAIAVLFLVTVSSLRAGEIEGTVVEVDGKRVTIELVGDIIPVVDDEVRVVIDVPGIGEANVGSGRVTEVHGTRVLAQIDRTTGRLEVGRKARIKSAGTSAAREKPRRPASTPTTRTPAAPPKPAPAPGEMTETTNTIHRLPPAVANPPKPVKVTSSLVGQDQSSREIVQAVAEALPRLHLSRHPVDEEIGRRTIQLFLERLDTDKLFFNQEDVDRLMESGRTMADQSRAGELSLAYEIFRLYLDRLAERVALGRQILAGDLDFETEEELLLRDPSNRWPLDPIAVHDIWRKWMKYHILTHRAVGSDWTEAKRKVSRTLDDLVARMQRVDDDNLRDSLLDAMAAAYDPHSRYMSPKAWEEQNVLLSQQMAGIGAQLAEIDGYVTVHDVIPNGPADKQGDLKPGDRIVGVGQSTDGSIKDTSGMKLADVVALIRGDAGTVARLRVIPRGKFEARVYSIIRDKVDLAVMETAVVSGDQVGASDAAKIGYVHLPTFYTDLAAMREGKTDYRSSARDLQPRLQEFQRQKLHVVVVDLRKNNGGTPEESIDTASLFLGGVSVMQTRDREGVVTQHRSDRIELAWDGPLVILTNRVTAGGAEILAAAIQDYDRGLVIGDRTTFGMGTVAYFHDVATSIGRSLPMGSLGYLRVTGQKFYRASGQSTQLRGVIPNIILPSTTSDEALGETLLPFALQADSVDALRFTTFEYDVPPKMQQALRQSSDQRRQSSEYFRQLRAKSSRTTGPSRGTVVRLSERGFLADRGEPADANQDDNSRRIPGTRGVNLDGYLSEAFLIALDYASRSLCSAAERKYDQGDYASARRNYEDAISADPKSIASHYGLAWMLSTCPERDVRDGEAAVRHATIACELSEWKAWHHRLALAIAEAEAGRFSEAQKHLAEALRQAPEDQRQEYEYLRDRFAASQPFAQ